jgi:hypothetical protein
VVERVRDGRADEHRSRGDDDAAAELVEMIDEPRLSTVR